MTPPESVIRARENLAKSIEDAEFDYRYPDNLDLRPKSELHKFIVAELMERVGASVDMFSSYKNDWKRMDWTLTSYMPANEAEAAITRADWRKPVNVVIPMTAASLEMYQTYFSSVFLGSPIHRYRGLGGPESILSAAKHEMLIDRQAEWFDHSNRHEVMYRDCMVYGRGAMALEWTHHKAMQPVDQVVTEMVLEAVKGMKLKVSEGDILRYMTEKTLFEGTRLRNLDPYRCIWDPNIAPNDMQDSTYVGWMYKTDSEQLLKREFEPESRMFNGKYAHLWANQGHGYSCYYDDFETGRNTKQRTENLDASMVPQHKRRIDIITMYMDIIPSEWGLGDEDYPVKWMFSVAGDQILVQCERCDYMHGWFPVVVASPNTDGYSVFPISHLMTTYGMQQAIDWYQHSHNANVRKAVNDMIIWDPAALEEDDMLNPGAGKLIRLKRSHMNRGVNLDAYVKQLSVVDVTGRHMQDAAQLIDLMRQANGTVDITMGDLSKLPERPTEAGINAATSGALSRLQRLAKVISGQVMTKLGYMLAYNNIQYMSEQDVMVPIAGRHEERMRREFPALAQSAGMSVSKWDLDVNFQVMPYDGGKSQPNDLAVLDKMMEMMLQVPENIEEISKKYPIAQVYSQWLRKHGATDIAEMEVPMQTQVMPDEQLQGQIEAGNMVSAQDVAAQQQQYAGAA